MGKKQDHLQIILDALQQEKKLSAAAVMQRLGISQSSVRRLLLDLEATGKAVRTHGGIRLIADSGQAYSFQESEGRNVDSKRRVAAQAVTLLQDDDIIYLDSGTTVYQLALQIRERILNKTLQNVHIITNSMVNLQTLQECCDVILIGGNYRERRKDFAGYAAERFIATFNYTKAFLGADGYDPEEGYMATDVDTAKLNEVVIKRTAKCYVLLDSSKMGVRSFVSYARASELTMITEEAQDTEKD